ncbi:hypothetical protein ACWGOE_14170, partial [Leucobacter chromiiresistens]
MATRSVNAAAGVILALDSARLLNSPQQAAEHEQLRNDITGACLARWEEEQDNARLRLALASSTTSPGAWAGGGVVRSTWRPVMCRVISSGE